MVNEKNYWALQRPDGRWEVKREGAERASEVFNTQEKAWNYARPLAQKAGGEAFLRRRDGTIRERNTYGEDPYPPKG